MLLTQITKNLFQQSPDPLTAFVLSRLSQSARLKLKIDPPSEFPDP